MTFGEMARDDYIHRAEALQNMAIHLHELEEYDRETEARMGALIVYAASRAETMNPENGPVQCRMCLGAQACDKQVHLGLRRMGL